MDERAPWLWAAVDGPDNVRGVVLINPSLRGLHVKKQPAPIKPFVKALQKVLRTTDIGQKFFGNVAQAKTVKNILKEAYGNPDAVTDELVDVILKPGLQPGAAEAGVSSTSLVLYSLRLNSCGLA